MKHIYLSLLLLLTLSLNAISQKTADRFVAKNPDKTFIGAIMEKKSINQNEHLFINAKLKPITISFSIAAKSITLTPSYENMMNVISEKLKDSKALKTNYNFSYSLKELKSYDDLSWYFGQDIDKEAFFGITKEDTPAKTTAIVDITQTYFSVDMDMSTDGKIHTTDENVINKANELIYINSIEFGRKVTVIVESNLDYTNLQIAIKEALDNSEGTPMSEKSKEIIANSNIRIMILSNEKLTENHPDNIFANIIEYLDKPVTFNDFGSPVYFQATEVKDASSYKNTYNVK